MVDEKTRIHFPLGFEYLEYIRAIEDKCSASTYSLNKIEDAESDKLRRLGNVLSFLYRLSCCHWGCHNKEHVIEYLSGRTVTSAHSGIRLVGFGYYDEALALARNIAEIGNLMHLFFVRSEHIRLWLDATDKVRKIEFSAAAVRTKLEKLGSVVPTDAKKYAWLCEMGTHVTPNMKPGCHNDLGQPVLGGVYQTSGYITAIDSLAWSVCTVAGPVAKVAIIKQDVEEQILEETIGLAKIL